MFLDIKECHKVFFFLKKVEIKYKINYNDNIGKIKNKVRGKYVSR